MKLIKIILAILLGAFYALYLSFAVSFGGSPDSIIEWVIWWIQIVFVTAGILSVCVYIFKGSATHKVLKALVVAPLIMFVVYYFIVTGVTFPIPVQTQETSSMPGVNGPVPVR